MRGRASWALGIASAVLGGATLATCSGPALPADGGLDAGADASEASVPEDTGPVPDAGPWRPAFAPRLIYENREVTCAPPPDFTYVAPERPVVAPGTVRWAYRPAQDPAARDRFTMLGITQMILTPVPIVGTPSGGLVAGFEERSYSLGVTAEGGFDFATRGYRLEWSASDHAPVWFGTASEPRLIVDASQDYGQPRLTIESRTNAIVSLPREIALPLPGSPRHLSELVRKARPTVLADGSIVWAPTDSTIMASCPDGRTRWIVEYDRTMPRRGGIMLIAPADRTIIVGLGPLYRLDYDGHVVAERLDLIDTHALRHYDETCGLAFIALDRAREGSVVRRGLRFVRGTDFSEEVWLPARGALAPTSDCGAWGDDISGTRVRNIRYRSDGSVAFTWELDQLRNTSGLSGTPIELEDGTWLLLNEGGALPPTITIIDDETGATVAQYPLDQSVIGESVVPGAYLITPDGTLYVSTTSGLSDAHHIVAIELGVAARMPYASSPGLNWARTNATWHL